VKISAQKTFNLLFVISAATWLFTACDEPNTYVEPPPPKVTVAQPLEQEVIDYLEFTGNTRAIEEVEVRARVAGFLQSMHFTPGTQVKKGDLLFIIDPREYRAKLNAAQAELESAKAQLRRAEIEFARAERIFKQGAGAERNVEEWRSQRDMAKASVAGAEAQVERARLDLSYTKVTAPISGRVSRRRVDLGNLVGEGEPTLLTKITQYDPIYAYFNLNELDLLKVRAMYRERIKEKGIDPQKEPDNRAEIPLFLGLADEEGYPHEGIADFAESGVDPATGTLQLRGIYPNSDNPPALIPGLFARIRMPIDKTANALLVTERAIGADQGGSYLLVVNSKNMVEKKPIRMGRLIDGMRVIKEGLRAGEWVVVKGLQRARPGAKVDPERLEMSSLTASALKAAVKKPEGNQEAPSEKEKP
jgi:RND family efflux transporter MFP subunit